MPSTTINGDRVPIRLWAQPHEVESDAIVHEPKQVVCVKG